MTEAEPDEDAPPPGGSEIMPIEKAPYRIRREYYRTERRNSAIAILVLTSIGALVVYGVWRIFLR